MENTIKLLRAMHKMTQEDLAKKIGITRTALSDIENNKVIPGGKVVIRVANIFKVPAEQIFFEIPVNLEEQECENSPNAVIS